jgi:hypothetical protein
VNASIQRYLDWQRVSDVEDIEYNLKEIDAMLPMTQQSDESFWRMGQSRFVTGDVDL